MERLAEELPRRLARAVDCPKSEELRTPTGGAKLGWLRMFWAAMPMPQVYLRSISFFSGLAAGLSFE
jgi:hypothetical protein